MSRQIVVKKNGDNTNIDLTNLKSITKQNGKIIIKFKNGHEIVLDAQDGYTIEIVNNNISEFIFNKESSIEDLQKFEQMITSDSTLSIHKELLVVVQKVG
jgi:hypothetical protein